MVKPYLDNVKDSRLMPYFKWEKKILKTKKTSKNSKKQKQPQKYQKVLKAVQKAFVHFAQYTGQLSYN